MFAGMVVIGASGLVMSTDFSNRVETPPELNPRQKKDDLVLGKIETIPESMVEGQFHLGPSNRTSDLSARSPIRGEDSGLIEVAKIRVTGHEN